MKDFLGQELAEGDEVVFINPGYRGFRLGKVVGITAKRVHIEHRARWGQGVEQVTLDPTYNVIKKPKV